MFKEHFMHGLRIFTFLCLINTPAAFAGAGDPCTVTDKVYALESPSGPSLICNGTTLQILESAKGNPVAKGIGTSTPVTLLTVEHTTNPIVTIGSTSDNGTPSIRLLEGMSLGGAGNKGFELKLDGPGDQMRIDRYENAFVSTLVTFDRVNDFVRIDGDLGIGKAPDTGLALDIAGSIEYSGTITDISDRRMKTDIQHLPNGQLDKILTLEGVSFKMKDNPTGPEESGFIAQDVRPVLPSLIHENPEGMLSMNYMGLFAPMVEAIKEQNALIVELKDENAQLLKRIEALEHERF
ncbi:MAG: tail fiber domain-containing protein [Alphaproteobacteria bacterium]|nr:tail fiber domain-containing protein [Alphaproteobacteria bacterium]